MKKRIFSILLSVLMIVSVFPISVSAGHICPDCLEWIDGDPYCEECFRCESCSELCDGCYDIVGHNICVECAIDAGYHCPGCDGCLVEAGLWCENCNYCENCCDICENCALCIDCAIDAEQHCPECGQCYIDAQLWGEECGRCDDCCPICENCALCEDCAIDAEQHCPECGECYYDVQLWCEECGKCDNCSPTCENCCVCEDCAIEAGRHCPDCGGCYVDAGLWCEECMRCCDCVDICDGCSFEVGEFICVDCAMDAGYHCPDCGGCYMESQLWCEQCMRCCDCVDICDYCSFEEGEFICVDCAVDNGLHCPSCNECYGDCGGEYCSECGNCANCSDICFDCNSDGICIDCAIEAGYHCPNCGGCGSGEVTICGDCGEYCSECASAFCESCELCSNCVAVCPDCGSCSSCETVCDYCGEHCSGCSEICEDCNYCEECCHAFAESEGCDCSDWVCIESPDWDDHFNEYHTASEKSHQAKTNSKWEYDSANHWHKCLYCEEESHFTDKGTHNFDSTGKCKICGYYKNSKIQIIEEPKDVTNAYVSDANEDYLDNRVIFRVKAEGNSELTYEWYCKYYSANGKTYIYDVDEDETDEFFGATIDVVVPTDACYNPPYYFCIITDEEGNSVTTREAKLNARHSYKYFDYGHTPYEGVVCDENGHTLHCCGEGCEAVTTKRNHVDENNDFICDLCEYEMDKTIKKINITFDYLYGSFRAGETENTFSSKLSRSAAVRNNTNSNLRISTELCHNVNGTWYGMSAKGTGNRVISAETKYAVSFIIRGKLLNGVGLPSQSIAEKTGFFCINGKAVKQSDFELYNYYIDSNGEVDISFFLYVTPDTRTSRSIAVTDGKAISSSSNPIATALPGDEVPIQISELEEYTSPEYDGEKFLYWKCLKGNVTFDDATSITTTFVMPDSDVEIQAVFEDSSQDAAIGDINGDGKIKGNDATLLLKYLADWNVTITEANADCNSDGKIKGNDATLLLKYLADWNVKLGK